MMKKWMAVAALGSAVMTTWVMAQTVAPNVDAALQAAVNAGVTQFRSVELDDDGRFPVEVEGWIGTETYVEFDMATDGQIGREERRPSQSEPAGLTLDELRSFLRIASEQGVVQLEDISVNRWGVVEVEGVDSTGRELELKFRRGEAAPFNRADTR